MFIYLLYKPGFSKVGHERNSGGHEQQRDKRGAMNSKGAIGGQRGHNFLKLTLDILKLQMKSKKKGNRCFFRKPCSRHYEKIVYLGAKKFYFVVWGA